MANAQLRAKVMAVARFLQLPLTTVLRAVFVIWEEGPASHVILGEHAVEFPNNAKLVLVMLENNAEHHASRALEVFELGNEHS